MTTRNAGRVLLHFALVLTVAVALAGCKGKEKVAQTAGYFNYQTECLGRQADGTQLLKVWAKGTSRADAVREAKKKAVEEVLFRGINAGSSDCTAYPVVDAPNARQKFEDYFNKFFTDGGGFKKYVDEVDKDSRNSFQGAGGTQTWGIVVQVDRTALKKRMQKDKIIE